MNRYVCRPLADTNFQCRVYISGNPQSHLNLSLTNYLHSAMNNQKLSFHVTHVEAEEKFLKIWAQTCEGLYQLIRNNLKSLPKEFIEVAGNLVPGTRCLTRVSNLEFQRIKLVRPDLNDMVLVHFLDYGKTTLIHKCQIRVAGDDLIQVSQLFELPDAATPFYLEGVVPNGEAWTNDVVTQIASILIDKRFDGYCGTVNGFKTLRFEFLNEDFGQTLVNRNMAIKSPTFALDLLQLHSSNLTRSNQNGNETSPKTIIPERFHNVVVKPFRAPKMKLDGIFQKVKVSHADGGPADFYIQMYDSVSNLRAMTDRINSQKHEPLKEPPMEGMMCLARHPTTNKLSRIILNSPGDTTCNVFYADYGNHEDLPYDQIYQIPDEFLEDDIFSARLVLSGITDWKITEDVKSFFGDLVKDKILYIRACWGKRTPLVQYCDLFLKDYDTVTELLVRNFPLACGRER